MVDRLLTHCKQTVKDNELKVDMTKEVVESEFIIIF